MVVARIFVICFSFLQFDFSLVKHDFLKKNKIRTNAPKTVKTGLPISNIFYGILGHPSVLNSGGGGAGRKHLPTPHSPMFQRVSAKYHFPVFPTHFLAFFKRPHCIALQLCQTRRCPHTNKPPRVSLLIALVFCIRPPEPLALDVSRTTQLTADILCFFLHFCICFFPLFAIFENFHFSSLPFFCCF